jgi:CubicO group peptidase (beta-lactamase class C family)
MASEKVHRENLPDGFRWLSNAKGVNEPPAFSNLMARLNRNEPPPNTSRIDKIVNNYLDKLYGPTLKDRDHVPGLAVAVKKDDEVVHLNCYGYANLETGAKITLDTIFDLGSMSKQFTAFAVHYLVRSKKIDLNDPLSKFFKGFPHWADITVEDLLHHTSGLPDYFKIYEKLWPAEKGFYKKALKQPDHWYPRMAKRRRKEITNKDVVRWIASEKLMADPDTEYDYSNSGYAVLAELVARVTKQRLAEYLKKIFFSKRRMNDTFVFDEDSRFSSDAREIVNHARCYNRVRGRFVPVGYTPLNFINGDGNVHSTILDLLRWELTLEYHEFDALCYPTEEKESVIMAELLWTPGRVKHGKLVDYGAGWHLLRWKTRKYERRAEYHRGVYLGWRSYYARAARWAVPEAGESVDPKTFESLGIIVLSNADFGEKQFTTCRIAHEISKVIWEKGNIMDEYELCK